LVERRYRFKDSQAGAGGTLCVIFVGFGPAEVGHHTVAEVFGDVTAVSGYRLGSSTMIASY
jgi:hypothetical protein